MFYISEHFIRRYLFELSCQWNYVVWQCREDSWIGVKNARTRPGENNCPGEMKEKYGLLQILFSLQMRRKMVCHYFTGTQLRFTNRNNWGRIYLEECLNIGTTSQWNKNLWQEFMKVLIFCSTGLRNYLGGIQMCQVMRTPVRARKFWT